MRGYKKTTLLLFVVGLIFALSTSLVSAELGWVGNMYPRAGVDSPVTVTEGHDTGIDVYLQVYKGGVTEADGAGDNINCYVHHDYGDGVIDSNWADTEMSYFGEVGNNDEYKVTLDVSALPAGTYEYTAACDDMTDNTRYWQRDGNGQIIIQEAGDNTPTTPIFGLTPEPGTTTDIEVGGTLNVSVDFYIEGVTDAVGRGNGVECLLWWDGYDREVDDDWNATYLSYEGDVVDGTSDRYSASILMDETYDTGNYGLTARCDYGDSNYWYGADARVNLLQSNPPAKPIYNMRPLNGTTTKVGEGETFTVSVDFYYDGITNAAGEGSGASCIMWWDGYEKLANNQWEATALEYQADASGGFADRYSVSIVMDATYEQGTYGYTTRCNVDGDPNDYWFGIYNDPDDGTLQFGARTTPDITNLQPATGTNTVIPLTDTRDFTFTLDFFAPGITDADPSAAGDGVQCQMWWDGYDREPDNDWNAEDMVYVSDIEDGYERYALTIPNAGNTLPAGFYGFTARCLADGATYWYGDYNSAGDGSIEVFEAGSISQERALWMTTTQLAWRPAFVDTIATYELHSDINGDLSVPLTAGSGYSLTKGGILGADSYAKFPNASGYTELTVSDPASMNLTEILRGQVAIAGYDANGSLVEASGVQLQGVLDDVYSVGDVGAALGSQMFGVNYNGGTQTLNLWAPTAQSVNVLNYGAACDVPVSSHPMSFDAASGVWSVTSSDDWNYDFYRYEVTVYSPYSGQIETNIVTDPYSLSLSTNNFDLDNQEPLNDQCSQVVDLLNDPALQPAGWSSLTKPDLPAPEDISVYELHVRDFSIFDETVPDASARGTFAAFTYPESNGMQHLSGLADVGLSHVHLLPVADSGTMVERRDQQQEPDYAALAAAVANNPASELPENTITALGSVDGFNWGYETQHFAVPEGAYSTDPNGVARIVEFRQMVMALSDIDLRLVIDVVYNHSYRAGQESGSVLDKIVPGYYQRLDANGNVMNSSCCPDTASEFDMMEKLIIDTVLLWAEAYQVDGFRFDLMNLHTRENMENLRAALDAMPGGNDIYVYGEGWDFGSLKDKGFDGRHATQFNMAGTGIGTFNDRIRDAVHGGFGNKEEPGFINGQSNQNTLHFQQDRIRIGLAGNLQGYTFVDANGNTTTGINYSGTGYTLDPQEVVNYITKHDNETLFDLNAYKLPDGTSIEDRVRVQNMGMSIVGLGQGVPFFHAGSDLLRSKSMDRDSYNSGDWFNRLDFSYQTNNFPAGLPVEEKNAPQWGVITGILQNPNMIPSTDNILAAAAHFEDILQIRYSSPLFRLPTADDVYQRVQFYNTGSGQQDALIVMSLGDGVEPDLDGALEAVWVLFNAGDQEVEFTLESLIGDNTMALHPVLVNSADAIVKNATFDAQSGTFSIPARTTAVFNSQIAPIPPSTIDWVGNMFPRGGQANVFEVDTPDDVTFYVQVYEGGVTDQDGQGAGIECYLNYGLFDAERVDLQMSYNVDIGNNDEYAATIDAGALQPGNYAVNAYCKKTDEEGKKWKVDNTGISPVDEGPGIVSIMPLSTPPPDTVFVHLFEWEWTDIAAECPYLADVGYDAVQVSPPQEHVILDTVDSDPWWTRYQPVSYQLEGRSGSAADFQMMIDTCGDVGVDIYVDAVINHMSGQDNPGVGTAGTAYERFEYPGLYTASNFHTCGTQDNDIFDYSRRSEVQNCELVNLQDLETETDYVRNTIRGYLQNLVDMGVAGFRFDASKHMPASDITAIISGLEGDPYIFQEVIGAFGEPVLPQEYVINGDVTEFAYSRNIGGAFNCGTLAGLESITDGLLRSDDAVIFVDNHDNQRGHGAGGACILDHTDGLARYDLGNVFMLAHPYGYPKVMSSYYWVTDNDGAPVADIYSDGVITGCNESDWVCEHRRDAITSMIGFRDATSGAPLTHWQTISDNQIAFGRDTRGFVIINNTAEPMVGQVFQTGLPMGEYCDVISGELLPDGTCSGARVTVNASGQIVGTDVPATGAIAIHAGSEAAWGLFNNVTLLTPECIPSGTIAVDISGHETNYLRVDTFLDSNTYVIDAAAGGNSYTTVLQPLDYSLYHAPVAGVPFSVELTLVYDVLEVRSQVFDLTCSVELTAQQLADVLAGRIDSSTLGAGEKNALSQKLNNAMRRNGNSAGNQMNAFINQVNDLVATGQLDPVEGRTMIVLAEQIIASLD